MDGICEDRGRSPNTLQHGRELKRLGDVLVGGVDERLKSVHPLRRGWKSDHDYRITRLLGFPLDRDYGDVDALAWDTESGRVLAMECKDLQFNKTLGEVAEQLSDFRGEETSEGKRDLLRKHLDRLIVMKQHKSIITNRLHLKVEAQIERYVVFKNPVPMRFSWPETQPPVKPLIASELETL